MTLYFFRKGHTGKDVMNKPQIFIELRGGKTAVANTLSHSLSLLGDSRCTCSIRRDVHIPRKFWVWQRRQNKKARTDVMYHRGCFTMPEGHDLSV